MAYSSADDLLMGAIPLPDYVDKQKYVQDASDEVDSWIGAMYVTPIDVTDVGPTPRYVRLLLKRVANNLATGRLILAIAGSGERNRLHAYGESLVKEACKVLEQISEGQIVLPEVPQSTAAAPVSVPLIYNKDATSNVDDFYDKIVAPDTTSSLVKLWPYVEANKDQFPW